MKILLINKFLYPKGGAEISTLTTGRILEENGHDVIYWGMAHPRNPPYPFQDYFVSQTDYDSKSGLRSKASAALNILYSFEAKEKMTQLLEKNKPDIVHLNNFAHQISPSILNVIKDHHIPVVMSMHDYKMVCPSYSMLAASLPCERCRDGRYYQCALNRCTKNSVAKSLINVFEMYLHHRVLHIYDKIDLYISPSRFLKNKVEEMGMKDEVAYLPNCVDVSGFKPGFEWREKSIVYLGRLSHEKGLETLIDAIKHIDIKLKIIGDGPLKEQLERKIRIGAIQNVDFLGYRTGQDLHNEIRNSMFLVIPTICYENNPLTVIEAFALGKPVLGARIGGIPELVRDWETGLCFQSGNVTDLKEKLTLLLEHKSLLEKMGKTARNYVEQHLNSDSYYKQLMNIYDRAAAKSAARSD